MTALPRLEVRETLAKGRGAFAIDRIRRGTLVIVCSGAILPGDRLLPHHFAMQIGADLWLCSDGEQIDDCLNHSCEPNVGFVTGAPELYALRDIEAGEEICWDYSTSLAEAGWSLDCRCGTAECRGVIRSFGELPVAVRERLGPLALSYLRQPR